MKIRGPIDDGERRPERPAHDLGAKTEEEREEENEGEEEGRWSVVTLGNSTMVKGAPSCDLKGGR